MSGGTERRGPARWSEAGQGDGARRAGGTERGGRWGMERGGPGGWSEAVAAVGRAEGGVMHREPQVDYPSKFDGLNTVTIRSMLEDVTCECALLCEASVEGGWGARGLARKALP